MITIHLSLFQRLACSSLVGLSRASLCVDVLEVGGRKRSGVARSLERIHCGGQAFKVLAVVFVGLGCVLIVALQESSSSAILKLTKGRPQ